MAGCRVNMPGGYLVHIFIPILIFAASCAAPPPTEVEVLEEDGGQVLSAGLVAIITIMSIMVVLVVLVVVSRSVGCLKPPFERLDNMPLVGMSPLVIEL
ncbi:unnamed protein product [Lota lota]